LDASLDVIYTRLGMLLAGFVEILDRCFVNERADAAVSYFDRVRVVPLDGAFDVVSAFEHEDHEGLGVHLLLQIKGFCVGALGASIGYGLLLMG
jgi:hypothetical protein